MSVLNIALISVLFLFLGYKLYGKKIERMWGVDPKKITPAVEKQDGIDYVSAKHWTILFGHHFASIAGAGPILGPVLAAFHFGWLPIFLWVILGTIFIGAVHDFSALMVSIRHQGRSIGDITEEVISYRAKLLFLCFLWLALVLVVSVFSSTTAVTLIKEPRIVIPTFGLIFIAILTGWMIYRLRINQIIATVVGMLLLVILFSLGYRFPIKLMNERIWIVLLLIYAFFASILPVNILLQPRDYLSVFILFFGLLVGYLSIPFSNLPIKIPVVSYLSGVPIWPMLFVFVACGAVSGFHSLVSSGTTSKQITNEKDAKKIGYGAMVLEGALAILALICVASGLCISTYSDYMKKGDLIGAFGHGYGEVTKPILGVFGRLLAMTMLNSFILTTLDTATRINRYITEELFYGVLKVGIFKNRSVATILVIIFALYLAFGNWKVIWPVFGASNQLVAALALTVVTMYLLSKSQKIKFTLYPTIFMLLTTLGALIWQLVFQFFPRKNYLLAVISIILIFLALFLIIESIKKWKRISHS